MTAIRLFIDDERVKPSEYTHIARTCREAIEILEAAVLSGDTVEVVSFDYDADTFQALTFMEIADWMAWSHHWPDEIRIHTANYWLGRPLFELFFDRHAPKTVTIDKTDPWNPLTAETPAWVVPFLEAQNK